MTNDVSIANTTVEERRKLVKDALAMASLGGTEPSQYAKELFDSYVLGEMELSEIKSIILEKSKEGVF